MDIKNCSHHAYQNFALLLSRSILGIIFLAHGAQKLFGAFNGPGLTEVVKMMGPLGYAVSIGEFFGGLGLLLGILSRFSAAAIMIIMIGAIAIVHGINGFFLDKGGFEYNFALIGLALITILLGPGKYSLSHLLCAKKRKFSCFIE